ncbi:MAG: hypothetical protein RLZZ69_2759, partial [Cyanobacteriota bacterium]
MGQVRATQSNNYYGTEGVVDISEWLFLLRGLLHAYILQSLPDE